MRCFTCGHVFADIELELENGFQMIDDNKKLSNEQKSQQKRDLIDKLFPGRWKHRYCCRARIITYVDEIKVVI